MDMAISQQEEKNKKRGMITSISVHIGLILLALLPLLAFPDPPPGQEGILVNLGLIDTGEGDDNAGPAEAAEPEESDDQEAAKAEETVEEVEDEPEPEVKKDPEPVKEKEVVKTEDPREIALKRKREKERKDQEELERKKQAEAEAKRKAEAEKKRLAEAAKKKKADEEARKKAEADKFKSEIGGLFGEGKGKGDTGKAGNQGDPGGDPNASNLEGISTGSGTVGGGLDNRGVSRAPKITDNSQKEGTVVVKVCVDLNGNVISSEFTQRGSTTADSQLKRLAVSNAKKWRFSKGNVDKQCGTITYRFKVK